MKCLRRDLFIYEEKWSSSKYEEEGGSAETKDVYQVDLNNFRLDRNILVPKFDNAEFIYRRGH